MRRVRKRGGNKEKVFGCDLLDHLNASSQEIPQVLRSCSEFVEKHGIVDGIYRLSGVSSNIQKLRSDFENDPNPDLNKDVYLQDIHCVSSLCKAYFRELPNPLLTYQLYDKYAEAVAIQLEEERLVKIRDVLKDLPALHYRTLEFLMRHLVKMASYSSETNMHARNLAIVWAPNLLRSKDIEVCGFNGTAAFMEVRVQSIVVEFILTHVPQLFPDRGASNERRKSLPSPSTIANQEEGLFKPIPSHPVTNFGNISPGHGPLAMRPYHAIIEGTDKRKGSLKGKKWMSIFNISGRFPDPRRKHKHSAKEKEQPALRPARSMDSLSTPSYPDEGSRLPAQRPPSTSMSPLVTASPKPGSEVAAGAIGGSEYAVTYRRGTGLVSGGAGTQGTYTSLDPEGLGIAGNESVQSRSPCLSTKAGRRAAMHITGPTIVTVPLHITSNLALGVLQGGGADRIIHRGRDKDGGDRGEGKEGGEKADRKDSRAMEKDAEEGINAEEEMKNAKREERGGIVDVEGNTAGGGGEGKDEGAKDTEEETEDCRLKTSVSREQQARSLNSDTNDEPVEDNNDYMVMKGGEAAEGQPAVTSHADDSVFDTPDVLNSTAVEGDDHELSGYVQDNFDFLDHMDCSMTYLSGFASQVNEFSVEPPGHSDDEYELMAQSQHSEELQTHLHPGPEAHQSPNELTLHRPLSLDLNNRYTKSLSLPYMTSPVLGPEESSSEEEDPGDCSADDYSSDEDECMFVKSLPSDFFLSNLSELELDSDTQESCTVDSPEERESEMLPAEEPTGEDQEERELNDDGLEEKQPVKKEEEDGLDKGEDQTEKHMQSTTLVNENCVVEVAHKDKEMTSDEFALCCVTTDEVTDESSTMADLKVEDEKEVADDSRSDGSPLNTDCCATQEICDVLLTEAEDFSIGPTEHLGTYVREDDGGQDRTDTREETEAESQETVLDIKESDEDMLEETAEEDGNRITDKNHEEEAQEGGNKQHNTTCMTSHEIWEELHDVICEVIEDEESEQAEREGVRLQRDVEEEVSREKIEEEEMNKADLRLEVEEMTEKKLSDPEMQQECEEIETLLLKASDLDVTSRVPEKENHDNDMADDSQRGVGRKLVVSKCPKVYQVKAVPVVPPKPQHCKITALGLRQQQQRERRDADKGRENAQEKVCAGEHGKDAGETRDSNRNSPLSMCFDEAVAKATMRREKVRECEKERQREWGNELQ